MKFLYLSCHSILEYDELSVFNELGINIFSPGAYVEPKNPGDPTLRPGIPGMEVDPDDRKAWDEFCVRVGGSEHAKERLDKEIADRFDGVIVMHMPDWISKNWSVIKDKIVIWRTIGQSIRHQELQLAPCRNEGMKIVRYSPREQYIPNFIGSDALIRFGKDPDIFKGWNGKEKNVVTFNQGTKIRARACNYDVYRAVTNNLPALLYGPSNEDVQGPKIMGKVPFEELRRVLRDSRVYFYIGTHPASYTLNFVESWMTGIPMVCLGPKWGHPTIDHPNHFLYEIPDLINNGVNGFYSDDINELHEYLQSLLRDHDLAKRISAAGRMEAIRKFDRGFTKELWKAFFKTLQV